MADNDKFRTIRLAFEDDTSNGLNDEEPVGCVTSRLLPFGAQNKDVTGLWRPLPSQVPFIWQVFVQRVDPSVKVLHIPTMTKVIQDCKGT